MYENVFFPEDFFSDTVDVSRNPTIHRVLSREIDLPSCTHNRFTKDFCSINSVEEFVGSSSAPVNLQFLI